jgi:hypothetical protein
VRAALIALTGDGRESMRPEAAVDLAEIADEAPAIDGPEGVMLAARADASEGDAASLVSQWEGEPGPAIVFTGYVPPGTAAERLTRSGRARYARWNVHPRLSDCVDLVRHTRARTVLPAFGDSRHLCAWEKAFAPAKVVLHGSVAL